MSKNTKTPAVLHGECIISKAVIPSGAVAETHSSNTPHVIIAESEVTGNHHVIDMKPGVEFYNHEGTRYMRNNVPTSVRCVIAERHSAIDLEPGEWKFGVQQEFDYFTLAQRNVQD